LAGRVVLVGVPRPGVEITLPLLDVFGRGGALKSSWYGDCLPERDFPYLIDLFLQGRLPLDRCVTGRTDLAGVDAALSSLHEGDTLRTVAEVAKCPRATPRPSPPARSAWTARRIRSTTTCGCSATTSSASSSTRRTMWRPSRSSSGTGSAWASCSPTPTTTTCASRPSCPRRSRHRSC